MNKKVAICFGGYCPLHQGHLDVIMKAKKENDICYVIVCGYDNEPRGWEINLDLKERFKLISDFFKDDEQIRVRSINDTELGLDESMSDHNWRVWQTRVYEYLNKDKVFEVGGKAGWDGHIVTWYVAESFYKSSIEKNNVIDELTGHFTEVKVKYVPKINQVSGTAIRHNPVRYWNKITKPFQPYLCKNILIIGTASEGKSTLVKDISRYFNIPYAEEYGRTYMADKKITDVDLTVNDFIQFLDGQDYSCMINRYDSRNGIFISDTDNTVTLMYAQAYVEDPNINISEEDYKRLYNHAKEIQKSSKFKWDYIFIFPPSKDFVDDGTRYMKQSSMDERYNNFTKLMKLVNDFYPEVSRVFLDKSFYENFIEVKNYINNLIEY